MTVVARVLYWDAADGDWCNRQHATLWMSKLGFESLIPSYAAQLLNASYVAPAPFAAVSQKP